MNESQHIVWTTLAAKNVFKKISTLVNIFELYSKYVQKNTKILM
jgi:hypothetical protein